MKWYWAILFSVGMVVAACAGSYVVGFNLVLLLVLGTAFWAALDSSRIQLINYRSVIAYSPIILFIGIALVWIVGFPWYLAVRYKIKNNLIERKEDQIPFAEQFKSAREAGQAFHICRACGITDKTHPDMDFRYCPDCVGMVGYCSDHLNSHEHVKEEDLA